MMLFLNVVQRKLGGDHCINEENIEHVNTELVRSCSGIDKMYIHTYNDNRSEMS